MRGDGAALTARARWRHRWFHRTSDPRRRLSLAQKRSTQMRGVSHCVRFASAGMRTEVHTVGPSRRPTNRKPRPMGVAGRGPPSALSWRPQSNVWAQRKATRLAPRETQRPALQRARVRQLQTPSCFRVRGQASTSFRDRTACPNKRHRHDTFLRKHGAPDGWLVRAPVVPTGTRPAL